MYITTDRGTQFECQLLAHFFRTLGFCRLRTNSFHPYGNGKVERFHRTLTAAVMSSKTDWIAALPVVFFEKRSKPDSNSITSLAATSGLGVLYTTTVAKKTAPIALALVKTLHEKYQSTFNTKDLNPTCRPQL